VKATNYELTSPRSTIETDDDSVQI